MKLIDARKKVLGWNKPSAQGMSTPAISYRRPVKCIAFHKGDQVSDHVLDWAIELATYGYITEFGKGLCLIPTKLYEQACRDQQAKADEYARQRRKIDKGFKSGPASPSIKKWGCIRLTSFLPKNDSRNKARLCPNRVLEPLITRLPGDTNRNADTLGHLCAKRNAKCLNCGAFMGPKRRDAKYCSTGCKQAAYRLRRFV